MVHYRVYKKLPGPYPDSFEPSPHFHILCLYDPFYYYPPSYVYRESRDSSVGIALGYRLDDRGSTVWFPAGAENFSLHHRLQNGSGTHPASYPMGTRGSFPGVKRLGREADHSPPSSAEVKEWVELYLHSPIRLYGVVFS
jgi:hypothetical protein